MKWRLLVEVEADDQNDAAGKLISDVPFLLVNSDELGWQTDDVRVVEFTEDAS